MNLPFSLPQNELFELLLNLTPSRRQGSTPDIPRPRYVTGELPEYSRTFGGVGYFRFHEP